MKFLKFQGYLADESVEGPLEFNTQDKILNTYATGHPQTIFGYRAPIQITWYDGRYVTLLFCNGFVWNVERLNRGNYEVYNVNKNKQKIKQKYKLKNIHK